MHKKRRRYDILAVLFLFFSLVACSSVQQPVQTISQEDSHTLKAAIVDQLSHSHPNYAFVKESTAILEGAGYKVDYYKGEDVTVEFYRNLPALQYDLIVFRVHSTFVQRYLSLAMFTSEPYSKERYVDEQHRNRVASGFIEPYHDGDPHYLVITDKFVRYSMNGSFRDTLIIMMGCTGMKKCMASAFLQKGAKAYIGWNGLVSAEHTDKATIQLLKQLLLERQTIAKAIRETMKEAGLDPRHKSMLLFWPIEAGDMKLREASPIL
jgi:hypothetical protein